MTRGAGGPPVQDEGDDGRIGPFRSWRVLYAAVLLYSAALILILYIASRVLDFRAP